MMICYDTSRDYKRLKELLDAGKVVVCFATYEISNGYHAPDVCHAWGGDGRYHITARGIEYTAYWPGMKRFASFEEACRESDIEFIEPTK